MRGGVCAEAERSSLNQKKKKRIKELEVQLNEAENVITDINLELKVVNDKFLKYTFHRKRKKRSLSNTDENAAPESNASNRILDEEQRVGPVLQKSWLSTKSSEESRARCRLLVRFVKFILLTFSVDMRHAVWIAVFILGTKIPFKLTSSAVNWKKT
ncbi:hypothetical protein Sjap_023740 [Stephania japonica]|uniref:Uncharacterized protein n=1 Tax=Stephania japonica TaxID=461633 RepID=A0AAP0EJG4_9MAGN